MKVLIMSVSAGGGHKNAADAIEEIVLSKDETSKVVHIDTIKYISPTLHSLTIGTYLNSIKYYPKIFKYMYKFSDSPNDTLFSLIKLVNEFVVNKLLPTIEELKPDIIIGTHPFTAFMIQILREKYKLDIPNMVIITDYGSHAYWVHPNVDHYIVAHDGMIRELTAKGTDREIIQPLGIPIKSNFLGTFSKEETRLKLGLDKDKQTITIMGGSLAMGNLKTILKEIESIEKDIQIVFVAANNQKLYEEAQKIALQSDKNISVLKYCNYMNALMQATDLLVTKPGGLTITEAFISKLPMAIFFAIPGQEVQNAQFLIKNGLAIDIDDGKDCKNKILSLLNNKEKLHEMSIKCGEFAKPYSTFNIYSLMEKSVKNYHENEEQRRIDKLASLENTKETSSDIEKEQLSPKKRYKKLSLFFNSDNTSSISKMHYYFFKGILRRKLR